MAFVPLNTNNSNLANYNSVNNAIRNLNNKKIKNDNLSTTPGEIGGEWTTYTPTITTPSGSFTSVSATGKYVKIGKLVNYQVRIIITTVGTATGTQFSLPFTAKNATFIYIGSGREDAVNGKTLQVKMQNTTTASLSYYDNTNPTASGVTLQVQGFYEAA